MWQAVKTTTATTPTQNKQLSFRQPPKNPKKNKKKEKKREPTTGILAKTSAKEWHAHVPTAEPSPCSWPGLRRTLISVIQSLATFRRTRSLSSESESESESRTSNRRKDIRYLPPVSVGVWVRRQFAREGNSRNSPSMSSLTKNSSNNNNNDPSCNQTAKPNH